jgi:hypothetical protein
MKESYRLDTSRMSRTRNRDRSEKRGRRVPWFISRVK